MNTYLLLEYPGKNLYVSVVGAGVETNWETTL